jgi:outer membrane lipoprotein-sorting protein
VLALIATQRPLSATEVARRARLSWQQIENYGCVFESRGVYQGQVRSFRQQQFFRRPHEFRLDTAQDYPLSTFVRADRVIHYLPGGVWEGQGPLVLVRPRTAGSTLVPFPFGSTWQPAENVSLERLITALGGELEVRLLGTGRTDEHPYYRLETRIAGPGGRPPDRYQLWIDRKTFLPFRVSWYRDPRNQIVTEARFLETNLAVLPAGTFEFQVPEGAFVVRGDADPHLLALPRDAAPGGDPVGAARGAAARRARGVPFKVFAPQWLPTGFRFVRARRKPGQWIDLHWIRETGPADAVILKLVEERASAAAGMPVGGEQVNLGDDRHPAIAYYSQQNQPFPCNAITWVHGGGRYTLSGVDLTRSDLCRIAGSMRLASLPTRGRAALSMRERSGFRQRRLDHAAPGVLPGSTFDEASSSGPEPAPAGESSSPALPMVPDMAEEDLGR